MFHNIPGVTKILIGRRFEQVAACFIMYLASPKYLPADVLRRFQYVSYDAWHSQNVCRQTFCVGSNMFHMMPGAAKTSAGRRFA